jgi:acyl-CoA synthetase (AMP-forming)/AMP-acid ligase II
VKPSFLGDLPASDRVAVQDSRHTFSYSDLVALAEQIAQALRLHSAGSTLVLSLVNSFEAVAAVVACLRMNASCALLPPGTPPSVLSRNRPLTAVLRALT